MAKKEDKTIELPKRKATKKEKIIITVSVIVGIILIAVMVLNIPMIPIERHKNGKTYTERVSIIRYIKETQPLAEKEGYLAEDKNSYELISGAEEVDDRRDFTNDQIIEGQFSVLVLGFDESRELSDVMMLCLFDINNYKLNILQIPRDSYVPEYTSSETGKINSVYTSGDQNLAPIQRTVNVVREMFNIPIDRYVTTGCDDIVDIVDILGGVPIDLPEEVFYSYDKILPAGEQVLDGEAAELMVRARKGYLEGDIGRVKAQRLFLTALMKKAIDMGSVEMTSFIKEVYDKKLVATDMTLEELSILADFAKLMDLDDVTVQFVPGESGDYVTYNGYSVYSIHKQATAEILNKFFRPYQVDIAADQLPITELITPENYQSFEYDQNQDTLKDIANGAKPGQSKGQGFVPSIYNSGSASGGTSQGEYYEEEEYNYNNEVGGGGSYEEEAPVYVPDEPISTEERIDEPTGEEPAEEPVEDTVPNDEPGNMGTE